MAKKRKQAMAKPVQPVKGAPAKELIKAPALAADLLSGSSSSSLNSSSSSSHSSSSSSQSSHSSSSDSSDSSTSSQSSGSSASSHSNSSRSSSSRSSSSSSNSSQSSQSSHSSSSSSSSHSSSSSSSNSSASSRSSASSAPSHSSSSSNSSRSSRSSASSSSLSSHSSSSRSSSSNSSRSSASSSSSSSSNSSHSSSSSSNSSQSSHSSASSASSHSSASSSSQSNSSRSSSSISSSSHSSSSSSSSSSTSASSISHTSTSSNCIVLEDESDPELTNPDANDYDDETVGYTNNCGEAIENIEIVFDQTVAASENPLDKPFYLLDWNTSSLFLKASSQVPPGGVDQTSASGKFTRQSGPTQTVTITKGVKQTFKELAKKSKKPSDWGASMALTLGTTFQQSAEAQGFETTAAMTIAALANAEARSGAFHMSLGAAYEASVTGIPKESNLSVAYKANANFDITLKEFDASSWLLQNNWSIAFDEATGNTSYSTSFSFVFQSADSSSANWKLKFGVNVDGQNGNNKASQTIWFGFSFWLRW